MRSRLLLEQISSHGIILQSIYRQAQGNYAVQRPQAASRISLANRISAQIETMAPKSNDSQQEIVKSILKESILSPEANLQIRPAVEAKPTRRGFSTVTKYELFCRVFRVDIPLGIVWGSQSTKRKTQKTFKKVKEEKKWQLDIVLHPLPALTNMVFRLLVGWSSNGAFSFQPRRYGYNHNPELRQCLNRGDMSGLCDMFSEGLASPDDLIAPWGNSLLHVRMKYIAGDKGN